MSNLVIVESPTKVKTIGKYLGKNYKVVASVGHIRDLPKSKLSVDVDNHFQPVYENKKDKEAVIKDLKSKARSCDNIFLATDPDREGEAISWHLATILDLDITKPVRVTFSEITKTGISAGMSKPRCIDMDLVNAQQTRRILDRIVGYKLSPFLWKKVRKGLSAGRVQSVAVRLIVDREEEIRAFLPEEYWTIEALHKKGRKEFTSRFASFDDKKHELKNKEQTDAVLAEIAGKDFVVKKIKKGIKRKQPSPPFTTSTLQQEAGKKLNFAAKRTMKVAQELYEGVEIAAGGGGVGLITYMRTDSLRISDETKWAAAEFITDRYGRDYLPDAPREYKSKKNAQDGHEAIRPADISIVPADIKASVTGDQYRLYKLIWERFMASQMANAVYNTVSVDIAAGRAGFKASGNSVKFDGFTVLYEETTEETESSADDIISTMPELDEGETLIVKDVAERQHFTQPPPRFTEAGIIKVLEENGIGRPSTYAPTLTTIIDRQYVEKEKKNLKPTILGEVTTKLLREHFRDIVSPAFTAKIEDELDKIESGGEDWEPVLRTFYDGFIASLGDAEAALKDERVEIPREDSGKLCELCGAPMQVILGRNGKFLGCSNYPECKNTKNIVQEADGNCPKCGGKLINRKSKKGRTFFACEDYTDCGFMTWDTPVPEKCGVCGSTLFKRSGNLHCLKCEEKFEEPESGEKS